MESEEQNSPKRSWSQTANELRGRYLRWVVNQRHGRKRVKTIKAVGLINGSMLVAASPLIFFVSMFVDSPDMPNNIVLRFLVASIVPLLWAVGGSIAIYVGLGKIPDVKQDEDREDRHPKESVEDSDQ